MDSTPTRRPLRPGAARRAPGKAKPTRIEVRLASKPRDYVPGSGPPLQRISLLPAQDSTAFIVDRILLPSPGPAGDGKPLPRRMTYIIGWHDLPAARLLVPAMEILRYVSPRDLETWEWDRETELEAERAKLEEERQKRSEQEIVTRKRGRPPVHTKIEDAIVAEPDRVATSKPRPKKGVMSLSTPQKAKLERFAGLSDDEASPTRQLERELLDRRDVSDSGDVMDTEEDMKDGIRNGLDDFGERTQREHTMETDIPRNGLSVTALPASGGYAALPALRPERPPQLALPDVPMEDSYMPPWGTSFGKKTGSVSALDASCTPAGWNSSGPVSRDAKGSVHIDDTDMATPAITGAERSTDAQDDIPSGRPTQIHQEPDPLDDSEGEAGWEVDRLEGMEIYDVEGRGLVRYFKVRWAGDWPSDRNPSWEPEDNLPQALIKNYMKNRRRYDKERRSHTRSKQASSKKPSLKQTKLPWAPVRQYSSVSEAFTDDVEMVNSNGSRERNAASQDLDTEEGFFVIE